MDVTSLRRKKWALKPDETILREESVDPRLRDKSEVDDPMSRYCWFAILSGVGLAQLYYSATLLLEKGVVWFGGGTVIGVVLLGVGIWGLRKPNASPLADMDRYLFTDKRIALLDTSSQIIDQIRKSNVGDISFYKRFHLFGRSNNFFCSCLDDPDRLFPIIFLANPKEIFEFVKTTYKGPTS